jgi:prepilin signal peptidase PulO-like enzyme (type II secretory pathway)
MPTVILLASCAVGIAYWVLLLIEAISLGAFTMDILWNALGAMIILPGFYYFMYKASKERWIGSGDAILCVPLALMLGNFWLAMFCLFGANMIGSIIMLPVTVAKKEKHAMIPFGPFLIIGFLVVFFLQSELLRFISL